MNSLYFFIDFKFRKLKILQYVRSKCYVDGIRKSRKYGDIFSKLAKTILDMNSRNKSKPLVFS